MSDPHIPALHKNQCSRCKCHVKEGELSCDLELMYKEVNGSLVEVPEEKIPWICINCVDDEVLYGFRPQADVPPQPAIVPPSSE